MAVDPPPFKREQALRLGATHASESVEAALPLLQELTRGQLADKALTTIGVASGDILALVMALVGKGGICVHVSVGDQAQLDAKLSLFDLTAMRKTLRGSWFGNANMRSDIPRLLRLYMEGKLTLDELITTEYPLDQVNEGYEALRKAENVRGLIRY